MNAARRAIVASLILPAFGWANSSDTARLLYKAELAWKAEKFDDYIEACKALESVGPSFSRSFNVALGLFRYGSNAEALIKIVQVQKDYVLEAKQAERALKLRREIEIYIRYLERTRFSKKSGTVTLNKRKTILSDAECPQRGRSANCLGIKPDQAEEYMKQHHREVLIASGYSVPVRDNKTEPEPE